MRSLQRLIPLLLGACLVQAPAVAVDFAFEPAIAQGEATGLPLLDIERAGNRVVAVGARGMIAVSDDEGASWRQVTTPVSATLTAVDFADPENGWAVGHAGTILHSSDGGDSWALQFQGGEANEQFLAHARQQAARLQAQVDELAAAEPVDRAALDNLQYTLEDAQYLVEEAETAQATGPADPFLDILMLDARRGFAVGAYGMLYRTADGGDNWQLSIDGIDNMDRYHFYAMAMDPEGNLYLSGEAGLLYLSRDGGRNWQRIEGLYEGSLFGLVSRGEAIITFGLRGNVFRSTDHGDSWQRVETGQDYSLYGGSVLGNGDILLFGAAGQVLLSSDGGLSFSASNHPARATFSAGIAGPEDYYFVVGMSGLEVMQRAELADD